jgi:hypothetical protein
MDHPKVMLVIGEHEWTLQALRLACDAARGNGNHLVLLKMVPVRHPLWLGADAGLTRKEQHSIREYASLVECDDVSWSVCVFQYTTYLNALVSASEQLDAGVIFASFPQELIAAWRRFKIWWLQTRLVRHQRALRVLD